MTPSPPDDPAANTEAEGTVLVVDDDETMRESLCEILEWRGYRTAVARDGVEALTRLRRDTDIRFMILDLMMPGMNGFQLLNVIAGDPRLRGLPLCVSSSTDERPPQGLPFLPKPIDISRLIDLVAASHAPRGR
jgi:CheY-like chemotaxis protein